MVNGRISFSFSEDPTDWIEHFKYSRAIGEIPRDISICHNPLGIQEIRISSDGGRLIRPLCVVKQGKLMITETDFKMLKIRGGGLQNVSLDELFRQGKIEYLDGAETEDAFIATFYSEVMDEDLTHCEVCPLSILGIAAGLSPYAECNQSPRNVYQAGMAKQAMGTPR